MAQKYVLVIDEGTTGTRALIVNRDSEIIAQAYTEFTQHHPASDRVEHDAEEIWEKTVSMMRQAMAEGGVSADEIAAIGITNQRATTVLWDRETGDPVSKAIVWQDTRTADIVEEIRGKWAEKVYACTGWGPSPGLFLAQPALDAQQPARYKGAGLRGSTCFRYHRLVVDPQADGRQGTRYRCVQRIGHWIIRSAEK